MTDNEKVVISYKDKTAEFPVVSSSVGSDAMDISKLHSTLGLHTFDQGFVNTASTKSGITFIDGDAGILRYRGYPIEQLAAKKSFLDVSYLLIYGELPNKAQLEAFDQSIRRHTLIHEDLKRFFDAFPQNAHPMSVLASGVSALSTFYQDSLDPHDPEHVGLSTKRLLAKLPVLAAYAHKKAEEYTQNPIVTKALDTLLILHADHEQNCSTSAVRLVGSAQANLFASVSAGINALFGPLHGGANEAVLDMLNSIRKSGESVQRFVERVKNKEDGIRLMGFGHRIYKNFDPRATIVKATADRVLADLGISDPLLDIAKELEATALADPYFAERKLYPNVDFYTGVIYKAMGFPPRMFTPLFAMGKLAPHEWIFQPELMSFWTTIQQVTRGF
ncbi:MAG: citrate (Si)-synthase [Micrococcales bacterium]|nr:citrate (Si)-synthase [Micrococcales bacterium]